MLDVNDVINLFKSDSYFTSDDLEKYKPVIIEYVNQKNNEAEVIYIYKYYFELLINIIHLLQNTDAMDVVENLDELEPQDMVIFFYIHSHKLYYNGHL